MLELAGLEGSYTKIQADEEIFARTVAEMRAGEWDGFNVTMPHKALAASSCDEVSEAARISWSVNTLFVRENRLFGESTDTTAMVSLLEQDRFDHSSPILLLGAGGGAAAVLAGIGGRDAYVAARRADAARELADRFGAEVVSWGTTVAGAIVVNSTPVGMGGEGLPEGVLAASAGLIDLAYGQVDTPGVSQARQSGLPVVDGYEFLVRQAIDSFAIWTGTRVAFERLMERLRKL